jgi:hypothetical protein
VALKLHCHAISWLMLQLSFLSSLGLCSPQASSMDADRIVSSATSLLRLLALEYVCTDTADVDGVEDSDDEQQGDCAGCVVTRCSAQERSAYPDADAMLSTCFKLAADAELSDQCWDS